jgi:hypothetical protein
VELRFSSDEAGVRFGCRVDSGAWVWCDPTTTLRGLGEGAHTVQAFAMDEAGNADASVAVHSFTVEIVEAPPPETPRISVSGAQSDTPTFSFAAAHASSYECRIDGGSFGQCSGNGSHTPAPLAPGSHTFEVRGVGPTGISGPIAQVTVNVADVDSPQIRIARGATSKRAARFKLTVTDGLPIGSLRCRLDSKAWADCSGSVTYRKLSRGRHKVTVRAVDAAGNAGTAARIWRVR